MINGKESRNSEAACSPIPLVWSWAVSNLTPSQTSYCFSKISQAASRFCTNLRCKFSCGWMVCGAYSVPCVVAINLEKETYKLSMALGNTFGFRSLWALSNFFQGSLKLLWNISQLRGSGKKRVTEPDELVIFLLVPGVLFNEGSKVGKT